MCLTRDSCSACLAIFFWMLYGPHLPTNTRRFQRLAIFFWMLCSGHWCHLHGGNHSLDLLFSFECCMGDKLRGCLLRTRKLAIFFWMLYRIVVDNPRWGVRYSTCYFLLNVVRTSQSFLAQTTRTLSCYFLLNVVQCWDVDADVLPAPSTCYFLLNVVR